MIDADDWFLLNDMDKYINPTDGEEITKHAPHLETCIFCWDQVRDTMSGK